MSDCIFCKVAAKQLPSHILYEDDSCLALLDAFPSSLGHALVIPKKHHENIFDIPAGTAADIQRVVVKTAKALQAALGTSDINILQNNGKAAGQTVFHYHVHLIPRSDSDNVSVRWQVANPSPEESAACAEKIRVCIQ